MAGSNLKYTQFVVHELKHANHQNDPFKYSMAWTRSHSRPLSSAVAGTDAKGHLQPATVQGLAGVGEGISWCERVVCQTGWCYSHYSTVRNELPHKININRDTRWAAWRRVPVWVPASPGCGQGVWAQWPNTLVGTPSRWVHPSGKSASARMETTAARRR